MNKNEIHFIEEDEIEHFELEKQWTIIIADDDPEVHAMTKIVLKGIIFEKKSIKMLNAYSGHETKQLVKDHPEAQIILLDVVMEKDNSGIEVIKYIREILHNSMIRIILRTGQPGIAPEEDVIINYDINDYKEKTELSSQKLKTTIISSLRSYSALKRINEMNENLEHIVEERTKDLKHSLAIMKADEEAGKVIQHKLLPPNNKTIGRYKFSHLLKPSLYLSGDFLDYCRLDKRYILFYFADVSGHGASSSFITVLLKSYIDKLIENYHQEKNKLVLYPESVIQNLNLSIIKDNLGKHLTIFYAVIDTKSNKMTFANGGQFPFPIFYCNNNASFIDCKSFPVGILDFFSYKSVDFLLPENFAFLLFSDGVLDILPCKHLNEKKEFLLNLIENNNISIDEIKNKLKIDQYVASPDDITILLIKSS